MLQIAFGEYTAKGQHQRGNGPGEGSRQDCSLICSKNGRYKKSSYYIDSQRNMELPNNKWDHDYCRIPVEQTKCGGRLGIPEPLGLKQLEFRILLTQKSTSIRFLPEKFHGNLIQ